MMKTCEDIARLVSEGHDRELSFGQRMKVRVHMAMCVVCRRFRRQLDFIRRLTREAAGSEPGSLVTQGAVFDANLSAEAKSRMKQELARRNPGD